MLSLFTSRMMAVFSKMSRPKPKPAKLKEEKRSFALGDEKAAKLSKSEQEQENKIKQLEEQKLIEETKRQIGIYRTHSKTLEEFVPREDLEEIRQKQIYYLQNIKPTKTVIPPEVPLDQKNALYLISRSAKLKGKKKIVPGNYTEIINKPLKTGLAEVEPQLKYRRVGALGVKLGMTNLWNKWGHMVPVTVIELDRAQIIQIKEPRHGSEYYQVQMGSGEPNYKSMRKSEIGHFLRHKVPPKRHLTQFSVSKQCLLPVGFMMTPRHYTPGMFIDVIAKTVGHGFQGTIKKYGFHRQPETHGNSTTTRVLGSTGCRQDPGRVFKGKKMYGQMGNKITVLKALTVFKIDVDKNLLFIKGSVPGKAGTIVKIRDTLNADKLEKNLDLVHYPTFVEEPGKEYARQMSMYCGERDPEEIEVHDNAYLIDDDEEEAVKQEKQKDKDLEE